MAQYAFFQPGLSMSLEFASPREYKQAFEDNPACRQRSVDAYIEYIESGNADPSVQLAAGQAFTSAEAAYNLLQHFERMVPIDDGVTKLRSMVRKEFEALKLSKCPDFAWWFFDKTVQLWGMHLGLHAGGAGFVVPAQFARRTTLPTFYRLIYQFMVMSPSRQAVLARNDVDEVHFLKMTMRSLVVDAIQETALIGLRAPFIGNFVFDDAKCEIHCKTIERSVSANLKQFVCYHSGWSQTQHLKQAPKWCDKCAASFSLASGGAAAVASGINPATANDKLIWLKNCDVCFAKNNPNGTEVYKDHLLAHRVARLLKIASYSTDPFPAANSGWIEAREVADLLMTKYNVWTHAELLEKLNTPGVGVEAVKFIEDIPGSLLYNATFDDDPSRTSSNVTNVYLSLRNVFT